MSETQPLRVLLVDDDDIYIGVVAQGLSDEFGCRTTIASTGEEALKLLRSDKTGFDVILLDYMMPQMNGLDVLRRMHEDKNETPVVVLTAAGSETVAVEAMKLGAYDYCRKEHTDIQQLANLVRGSYERRLFRIAKEFEGERAREIILDKEATDKVRDVINAITPSLNSAFGDIAAEVETKWEEVLAKLPQKERRELRALLNHMQKQVGVLETGIRGLLSLYQLVYARYPETKEIENIRKEFEARVQSFALTPKK
ncbi:MAG: response regulator [Ignavibacteriales bacterium]|nr:response regulator [Ignavibacteriales bacterium]